MAEIVPLAQAVSDLVRDGDTVALEGFTHIIPFAADPRTTEAPTDEESAVLRRLEETKGGRRLEPKGGAATGAAR
ncbi:hypothetical protein ACNTMW_00555 [Planosporangium sp. 12N6]|uniref:hypothetical protein n=1 Tax=Planosporangium spinosum TaxID=3402278 RepID=UPI003CF48B09